MLLRKFRMRALEPRHTFQILALRQIMIIRLRQQTPFVPSHNALEVAI